MPKRIIILDPNGVEVFAAANRSRVLWRGASKTERWEDVVSAACTDLADILKRENPKLGTYTVTVKEVGDD
jgi:hypothetical protein